MLLGRYSFDQGNRLTRFRIPKLNDRVIHGITVFVFRVAHFNIGDLIVEPL